VQEYRSTVEETLKYTHLSRKRHLGIATSLEQLAQEAIVDDADVVLTGPGDLGTATSESRAPICQSCRGYATRCCIFGRSHQFCSGRQAYVVAVKRTRDAVFDCEKHAKCEIFSTINSFRAKELSRLEFISETSSSTSPMRSQGKDNVWST
jgi:hypothetical protein